MTKRTRRNHNTDQGSQFASLAFTSVLHREKTAISMDGRGG